ncbi:MAG TPA: hypothetical protein VMQ63_08780, partial [Stellaceae bacterium]|nr:hypothetical protein [Stellaceae bacterium]
KELLEKKGLVVQIFPADKCCIKSGAIYAYHRDGLERVLRENEKALVDQGWPIEPRSFIARAANEWLDNSHPIYKVVARAFDD